MAVADELIALLGYDITGEDVARRYEGSLKRMEQTAERVGNAIGVGMRIATAAAAAGMAVLGKSVISTSAEFEGYQATLETIEGSSEQASKSLDWISGFAETTPYDVAQVTDAFIKLKAYGIDPVANDALKTLGDTASAMGKGLNQAIEAFADAQTGEFERLKEFGIKSKKEGDNVTFSWTENGKKLTKTVKNSSDEISKYLLDTMGNRFSGAMDRQSRTWNGMMSNLGDSWTNFKRRIGDAGFFGVVSTYLTRLLLTIKRLDKEGKLDEWAQSASKTLVWFSGVLWALGTRIAEVTRFMIDNFDSIKPVLIALGVAFGVLLVWAFPILTAFIAIGLAIDDLISYLQGGESVIGSFIDWVKKLPETLAAAGAAFGTWLSNIDWVKLGAQAGQFLVDAIVNTIVNYLNIVTTIGDAIIGLFTRTDWGAVVNTVVSGFQAYLSILYGFWTGVGARIRELILEWFNVDLSNIGIQMGADLVKSLIDKVRDIFTNTDWGSIIVSGFRAYLTVLYGFWSGVGARIQELIKEWFNIDLVATGTQMANDILTGLQTVGKSIKDWFLSLFEMPEWLKGALGIGGPVSQLAAQPTISTDNRTAPQPTISTDNRTAPQPTFTTPSIDADAWVYKMEAQKQEWQKMLENANENLQRMAPDTAVDATITDARTDSRSYPMTNTVTVHQTVTQATNAPAQAAQATGQAVQGAIVNQRSQIETEPSF